MITSDDDYTSDESMSLTDSDSDFGVVPEEYRSNNQSKHDSSDSSNQDSLLKRAIKENENSIIQSILSPPPVSSLLATSSSNNSNTNTSSNSSADKTTTITKSEGLSPLLDYLFQDGQLTRIEYDRVDKGHGMSSAAEQAHLMLRILMESKNDEALEILLECLSRLDPVSETIRRLCTQFQSAIEDCKEPVVFRSEVKLLRKQKTSLGKKTEQRNIKACAHLQLISLFGDYISSRKSHDFYYGRRQIHNSSREGFFKRDDDYDDKEKPNGNRKWSTTTQQQMNKTLSDFTDSRDFYLTSGCLETIRHLILDNCEETTTAVGWEKVLRNMNGLLNTDVLPIKDSLFQIKTRDHELALEEEARDAKVVRKIQREWRRICQLNIPEKQKREKIRISGGEDSQNEEALRKSDDQNQKVSSTERKIENKQHGRNINWNQVIYHSFQVWKQRNGVNSTFYSLIGIFQQCMLYRTADLLLECKQEIQLRENEKDITDGSAFDVNNGTSRVSTTTMLEKSDFLRKFYSPSRRSDNGNFQSVGLIATKDRVSASPVLSLDLL